VYDWAMKYRDVAKPYIDEEYGYEGAGIRNQKGVPNAPGHGQSADWVRRCHWSIAMAGGYATYGDWSDGVSYFYMGVPGPGKAAKQLKHLREFFEALPFSELDPASKLVVGPASSRSEPRDGVAGFCLAKPPQWYIVYLPRGGQTTIDLSHAQMPLTARWFAPRTGESRPGP